MALRVPGAPVSLVQDWVQEAYNRVVGRRHWAWLRRDVLLSTLASRSLSVTFTQSATAITSAAGFVVATDPGRQIRAGANTPVYTIDTVSGTSNAVLTQAYAGSSGAATATISDIYLPMPADFRAFETVTDMSNQRPIAWWISKDRLNLHDPGRTFSDSRFRVLASAHLSQTTALAGRVLYEAWPHPTAAGTYLAQYFARTDALTDDTTLTGVLATWTDALKKGALAEAAQWPGTATQKNPYFNLSLADRLRTEFDQLVKSLDVMDDDQYLMDLQQVDLSRYGLLSADTTSLRQTDATLADYL